MFSNLLETKHKTTLTEGMALVGKVQSPGTLTAIISIGLYSSWPQEMGTRLFNTFVQSHLPILQPVRKENSSGQFLDGAQESELWKAMEEGGVDVYFAGDVHRNTATKSENSNLIQVVTMSNFLLTFLRVKVTDTSIEMVTFGTNIVNDQYDSGSFHETDKSVIIKEKERRNVLIDSSGDLKLMDLQQPLIFFGLMRYDHSCRGKSY